MEIHLLIAAYRPMFRKGLYSIFAGEPEIDSIVEAATSEELYRKLQDNSINFVVAHQSLITNIFLLPQNQFVLLAAKPDREIFLAALKHGVRNYLLDDAPEDLLKKTLHTEPRECIFDLALTPWITSLFAHENEQASLNVSDVLSIREQEVLFLKKNHYSNKVIAEKLCIAPGTVKSHLQHIRHKLPSQR